MSGTDGVVLDDHRAIAGFDRVGLAADGADEKGHLRQFQARLSERLRQAGTAPRVARLGLLVGERRWLVDLAEAGEIVPLPSSITPVPLTRPWFRGLVNLRGALFGVSDLQRFVGEAPTPVSRESRLLAFGASMNLNAALLVSRMLGLHDPAGWRVLEADAGAPSAPWAGRSLVDGEGRVWHELSLARLAADERFLTASR
ncbi:MAG TPA: chemotaxis protein CheW [Quisquiliibacterium sp.]|nr:chemotaxis protein CheW [Quisquiliibacterium sp.]